MPDNQNITQIIPPRVAMIDERTGAVSREWYRWFYNIYYATGGTTGGFIPPGRGGTGTGTIPADGQLLIGDGATGVYNVTDLGTGDGIAKTIGHGTLSIENTGVLSFSGGVTGLTPINSQTGNVVLGGTLEVASGGTGANTPAGARANLEAAKSGANSDITSMSGLTGPIATPTYIDFNTASADPTRQTGRLFWDDADGNQTLSLYMAGANATMQIGEEIYYRIKASSAITEGQVVMFTGTLGASGTLTAAPATGLTAETASYVMGIATEDIANNGFGYITQFGLVRGINTTGGAEAWVDGQILYLNPAVAGGLTKTVPSAPNPKVQVCAVVNAGTSGSGSVFVRPTYGGKLGQFEGDVQVTTPASNDVLLYNGTKWINSPASGLPVTTATNLAGGAANRIAYQTAPGTTSFITAPTISNTYLEWSGSTFQWSANPLGTATSVGLALPTEFTVTNSPVTSSGTLTATWKSETANYFFAAPNGSAGTPTFRAMVAADVPTLNQDTTGTAAKADTVKTVSASTNTNYYLTFVDSDNSVAAYESVYTDAGITYNPSTNSITNGISGGTF